jgi:hypothetical protein
MCRIDHGRVVCCEDVGSADHFDGENSFPISSPRHVAVRAFCLRLPKKVSDQPKNDDMHA